MLVFLSGLSGYLLGAGMIVTGLLKPFFASRTGLWTSGGRIIASGVQSQAPLSPAHEVLGWGYTPAALAVGCLLLISTTVLMRLLLRLYRQTQNSFHISAPHAA